MATKEPIRNRYVGHRYVPMIMGEWDKTFTYEGLSIVLHEGNSFTSTGRVPVGIEITNEKYWKVTGNYNAQVEGYRQETKRVSDDLTLFKTGTEQEFTDRLLNIKSLGAKGDGVTDDTPILLAALQLINEKGIAGIFFPKGIYMIDTISESVAGLGFTLKGESGSVIRAIRKVTNRNFMIRLTTGLATNQPERHIFIDKLTFDGNAGVSQLLRIDNETLTWAKGVTVENSEFKNCLQTNETDEHSSVGLYVRGAWDTVQVHNSAFANFGSSKTLPVTRCILTDSTHNMNNFVTNTLVTSCTFKNVFRQEDSDAIFVSSSVDLGEKSTLVVSDCIFESCEKRFIKSQIATNLIKGNTFKTSGYSFLEGIDIQLGGGTVTNNRFVVDAEVRGSCVHISTRSGKIRPSIVEGNTLVAADSVVIDRFVSYSIYTDGGTQDAGYQLTIRDNLCEASMKWFALLAPVGGTAANHIDGLIIEGNSVRKLTIGFIHAYGRESQSNPNIRATAINNFHRGVSVPGIDVIGSVRFTFIDWKNNTNLNAPYTAFPANSLERYQKSVLVNESYAKTHRSGLSPANTVLSHIFKVPTRTAVKVKCGIGWSGPGAIMEMSVYEAYIIHSDDGSSLLKVSDVHSDQVVGMGTWTVKYSTTNDIIVEKSAGTRNSYSDWWITVEGAALGN